jgi:beta-xylosidase
MFGQSTALSLAADGRGLLLFEFFGRFDYPSEVYAMNLATGKSTRAFRRKDRAVTDVLVTAQGPAYLAAIEPPGTLSHSPVPGKLKILKSDDLENWTEISVDYRAVARRAYLATPDGKSVWVATDTGMILKLE